MVTQCLEHTQANTAGQYLFFDATKTHTDAIQWSFSNILIEQLVHDSTIELISALEDHQESFGARKVIKTLTTSLSR
jgi:hypothetical protein